MLRVPSLPRSPGSYAWWYADAQCGPYVAVCIFMVGAVFSPRYAHAQRRGASPFDHCAVNCALHRGGRRVAWAFTEHRGAWLDDERRTLRIGGSLLEYAVDGTIRIAIEERTAPWGRPVRLDLVLTPLGPAGPEVSVDAAGRHRWQPLAPRAAATLRLAEASEIAGIGYHDRNAGTEQLGATLRGWRWSRVHDREATWIRYVPAPPAPAIAAMAREDVVDVRPAASSPERLRRSRWGLPLPATIHAGTHVVPVTELLESSPFYARQQGRQGAALALAEVADFARFHSPLIRWMAYFRMRREAA